MDEILYIIGAVISVAWSLWLYSLWEKVKLSESSPFRFLLLFFPATTFLLISLSGWSSVFFLRVDMLGLLFFFLLIILTWLFQFLTLPIEQQLYKKLYVISLIINLAGSLGILAFVYALKLYPIAGISIFSFFKSFKNISGLKIIWYILNPESSQQDTFSYINKLLIAICSYLPLTLVRMWYTNRKFKQLKKEIDELKIAVKKMTEKKIHDQ